MAKPPLWWSLLLENTDAEEKDYNWAEERRPRKGLCTVWLLLIILLWSINCKIAVDICYL